EYAIVETTKQRDGTFTTNSCQIKGSTLRDGELLRFDITLNILNVVVENVRSMGLFYPFHQPPAAFTYDERNRNLYKTVDDFIHLRA
ncbi:MAG TPA: hypothetical protein VFS61_04120, partial [Anaerolineales bacterium]|nr:hypothetical protein [Anaerolineales bacterium]